MSRHYLESHKFYVENEEDKLIYKVGSYETYADCNYLRINLELVAGWDYVNPDENDIQGWCPADKFVEDVQTETVIQYFLQEGMKEALEANDYKVLENIGCQLQKVINGHNEA